MLEALSLYPETLEEFNRLEAAKAGIWTTPEDTYPHVQFDPFAHIYYSQKKEQIFGSEIEFYREKHVLEVEAYRHAAFLDITVPETISIIFYVHVPPPSLFSKKIKKDREYDMTVVKVTQEVKGKRLDRFLQDQHVDEIKRKNVRLAAGREALRGKVLLADMDRHEENMFLQNPEQEAGFEFSHIDLVRANLSHPLDRSDLNGYFSLVSHWVNLREVKREALQQMFVEQRQMIEKNAKYIKEKYLAPTLQRIDEAREYVTYPNEFMI